MKLGKIVAVGVISLGVFAAGIGWSYALMKGRQAELGASGVPRVATEIGKPEIGIVDQVLFSTDRRLEVWKEANRQRLSTYGWIDRPKGIAHIPIEVAMQQVVANPPDIAGEGVPPVTKLPAAIRSGTVPPSAGGGKPGRTP